MQKVRNRHRSRLSSPKAPNSCGMFILAGNQSHLFQFCRPNLFAPFMAYRTYVQHKVALCQLAVSPDRDENIARARARVEAAADAGAKLVVLPEIWSCPYAMETLPSYAEDIDSGESPSISMLSEVAAARKITIVGGSIPEKASGKVFNTCCVIGPDGQILAKHRKLHLFEIDIPGDITLKESDVFTGGQVTTTVDTDVGRIGIGICHDIRFPELAMLYRSKGVHLICYPSAFNMSTGELLWDLMQKSRAVDNQLFVATCSPARDPNASSDYMIWAHSSLIGPLGEVIAAAGHEEATVFGEIDLSRIQSTRENLPLEMQSRGDLYRLVDVLVNDSMWLGSELCHKMPAQSPPGTSATLTD